MDEKKTAVSPDARDGVQNRPHSARELRLPVQVA